MATVFNFNGEEVIIPGTRSRLVSGVTNQPQNLSYATCLVIDTGSGADYGYAAGINGEFAEGKDSIYEFTDMADWQNAVGGGLWWLLAKPLFKPAGFGIQGVSKILYARAADTTAASLTHTFLGDGTVSVSTVSPNGGVINLKVKYEGVCGNGSQINDEVSRGFGVTMHSGIDDTAKFVLKFWRGTYKGLDENSLPFDGISEADALHQLLFTSLEFDNISTLITWMTDDFDFNQIFSLTSSTVVGDGTVDEFDLSDWGSTPKLFAGGTETFNSQALADVLEQVADMDFSFIFADKFGVDSQHANNYQIGTFANNSIYKPEVYIASGSLKADFATSKSDCAYYDNENVSVVHGGCKINGQTPSGYRQYGSYYKAALILGREAGRPPQVPITLKNVAINAEVHPLSEKEVKQALKAGLLVTWYDGGLFVVVKGVNSLQKNTYLLNEEGTTHSKQLRRIGRQLNKEIIINSKKQLLEQEDGPNRNTLSEAEVKTWLFGFLKQKTATAQIDNLIISQRNINVTRNQDAYNVTYEVVINTEISFILFTGTIVDL